MLIARPCSSRNLSPRRARRGVLQSARHGRTVDQGGQDGDQMDAAVVPPVRHNAVRLQLHALAYNLANFMRTLALPKEVEHWSLTTISQGEAGQGRSQGRRSWPLRHVPDGRGRRTPRTVPGHPEPDRRAATTIPGGRLNGGNTGMMEGAVSGWGGSDRIRLSRWRDARPNLGKSEL
jgi:hypothetical protein